MKANGEIAQTPGRRTESVRAVIWKELRQNLGWFALGVLAATSGFVYALRTQAASPRLLLETTFNVTLIIPPLVGLMMGLVQVIPENRGDKWGFLVHRPVSLSTIFFAKAFSGLVLYTVAIGIPLAGALGWMAAPGHIPMPFDPRIALPGIADLFCGIAYYFAGVLIGMRDARWYGSRLAGIGVPLLSSVAVEWMPQFWQAILCCAIGVLLTGAAAWGTFISGGQFENQPRTTRSATGVTVGAGFEIASLIAVIIVQLFFVLPDLGKGLRGAHYTSYTLSHDGTIVQATRQSNVFVDVKDLEGHPIDEYNDPAARQRLTAGVVQATAGLGPGYRDSSYRETTRFFVELVPEWAPSSDLVSWRYVHHMKLIAEYDNRSAELIGWLGPDGFFPGKTPPARRFDGNSRFGTPHMYGPKIPLVLPFSDAVYRLDLNRPKIERIFKAAAGESVVGASNGSIDFDVIATTQRVILQDRNGSVQLMASHDPQAAGYLEVRVLRALQAGDVQTFLWYYPSVDFVDRVSSPPQQVTRFGVDGRNIAHYTLPSQISLTRPTWERVILPWLVTPITAPIVASLSHGPPTWRGPDAPLGATTFGNDEYGATEGYVLQSYSSSQLVVAWTLSALASLMPAALAYRRGRTYAFTVSRLWLWTALAFVFGPPGFVLMVCLIEWPALEACPACRRMRVVTRERCEHCDKRFPAPPTDGTEIFESASA